MSRVDLTFAGNSRGAVGAAKETAASIAQVRREATAAEHDLGRLSRGALAGSGVFRGLGRSVAFASAGFLGGYGLTAAISGAFGELEKGQAVSAQTTAALKSTGAVAGITAKGIRKESPGPLPRWRGVRSTPSSYRPCSTHWSITGLP